MAHACFKSHQCIQGRKKGKQNEHLSDSWQKTNLLLWRAAWRPPLLSRHSCPQRRRWRRNSSPSLGLCPPWPGPGRSLEEPPLRRSRSACHHSTLELLMHSWSAGSSRGEEKRRALTQARVISVFTLACWSTWTYALKCFLEGTSLRLEGTSVLVAWQLHPVG